MKTIPFDTNATSKAEPRRMLISAGTAFGLFYGLGFALLTWGYDGLQLKSASAATPWIKLSLGLLPALTLAGVTGRLAALTSRTGLSALLWAACGWLLGILVGHIPFDGQNLWLWLTNPRLHGEIIFNYDYAAEVRTTLIVLILAATGVLIGLLESAALQWAWDLSPGDRLGKWAVGLLLCLGIFGAVPMALTADSLLDRPLRSHQIIVSRAVQAARRPEEATAAISDADLRSVRPFLPLLTDNYTAYFVSFGADTRSWHSAYVDLAFDNDFLLRCVTSGRHVIYCDDYSRRFVGWMDDLVRAGLYGEHPWERAQVRRLKVNESLIAYLEANRSRMSDNYTLIREETAGRLFLTAHFDTDFTLTCCFHGAAPVIAERCSGQ